MQHSLDRVEHHIATAKNDFVRYTKDVPAALSHPSIATSIMHLLLGLVVRWAVEFDDQFGA